MAGAISGRRLFLQALSRLLRRDVYCLLTFRVLLHVKADFLVFLERLEILGLNSEKGCVAVRDGR
jgi:hypothetical protein